MDTNKRDDAHIVKTPRTDGRQHMLRAGFVLGCALLALARVSVFPERAESQAAPTVAPPALKARPGHRTADQVFKALALGPHEGECDRCHTMHAGDNVPQPYALAGPDDNSLCDGCHTQAWQGGSYGGPLPYLASAHGSDPDVIWPGPDPPARTESQAAGKCVNCHDPHSRGDASGVFPALGYLREEAECFTCHDGSPAVTNVRTQAQKAFRHPTIDYSGRHTGALESQPSDFGASPINRRHAECVDCHNPHLARADELISNPARPSNTLLGTSRVVPLNGPAGLPPAYTFLAGADTLTSSPAEYQVCFKCHSGWTTQPSGQTDMGRVLNPANPSYHPVEDVGKDATLSPLSFTTGWNAGSKTRCGDCHGDDFDPTAGPHGSSFRYILKRAYTASPNSRSMASDELCFSCHSYDVYANPSASSMIRQASRFNQPLAGKGHAEHVGEESVPCYACHVTHGSTTLPHLLVTGRNPGIVSYTETPTGGTCTPTCHGPETYTVNYAR